MFASSSNYEDVKKYYHQTYIKVKDFGDEIVFVERVTSERMELMNPLTKEPAWLLLSTRPYELSFVLPRKTVYQYGDHAVMLSRIPARMWKKGMTPANTQFQILGNSSWSTLGFDIHNIVAFVNKPTYLTYEEAKYGFTQGSMLSAALTNRIALTVSGNIYVDSVLIARLEKETITTRTLFVDVLKPLFPELTFKVLK